MTTDSPRNFSIRFLESALRRVDSIAKPFYGGRLSTGEAIRRLAEERLEEIESSQPQESTYRTLVRLMGAWRSGQTFPRSDLQWLALSANDAYQHCKRDFVSKELLVANVRAFGEAVRLATRGKAKAIEPEERYFIGNLGTRKEIEGKSLSEYVDKWIAQLADRPSPSQAEFASRNLFTYLRDEKFADDASLAKAIAQYIPALLQLAIRDYWATQGLPLLARAQGSTPDASRTPGPITVGNVRVVPAVREDAIEVMLEMLNQAYRVVVRNFVELEDLLEITQLACTGIGANAGSFEWLIGASPKTYTLSCERARWDLSAKDFESLAQCLESLHSEPWMVALVERLRYVYGRV